jgi:hypothetical protein
LRLPDPEVSDIVQRSSPVTAAGPSPIRTEFPIKFTNEHLNVFCRLEDAARVKRKMEASFFRAKALDFEGPFGIVAIDRMIFGWVASKPPATGPWGEVL